jgi:monofunctional glycosyltransferase
MPARKLRSEPLLPALPVAKRRGALRRLLLAITRVLVWTLLATVAATGLLRWVPPPTSSFMIRWRIEALLTGKHSFRLQHRWVGWRQISPNAGIAVVAAEDQRFPQHSGFDFDSIADAVKENARRKRPRGASTITQQVAKNLFLWPGRSLVRKALEAYFTVLMEAMWPKRRILEIYLNIAEFGPGVFGIRAASETFFHKSPSRLAPDEAALLAAVLPSPTRLHVSSPSAYVLRRAQKIEQQVMLLGGPGYLKDL